MELHDKKNKINSSVPFWSEEQVLVLTNLQYSPCQVSLSFHPIKTSAGAHEYSKCNCANKCVMLCTIFWDEHQEAGCRRNWHLFPSNCLDKQLSNFAWLLSLFTFQYDLIVPNTLLLRQVSMKRYLLDRKSTCLGWHDSTFFKPYYKNERTADWIQIVFASLPTHFRLLARSSNFFPMSVHVCFDQQEVPEISDKCNFWMLQFS